ncbi:MAG: hypothetical protein ABSG39_03555 [Acidimicrobiales bacterium]|jgi:glutathione synthase/RimK-type ligase-like ATP-grasp enzyme
MALPPTRDGRPLVPRTAVWSDPGVEWSSCGLVVANGVWDNSHHTATFFDWLGRLTSDGVPVVNSPATLRSNIDKRYPRDLERAGVPTVPTLWVEPDEGPLHPPALDLPTREVVVKPSVSRGGGGRSPARPDHLRAG